VAGVFAFMGQLVSALSPLGMAGGLSPLGKLGLLLRGFVFQALGTVWCLLILILIFIVLVHGSKTLRLIHIGKHGLLFYVFNPKMANSGEQFVRGDTLNKPVKAQPPPGKGVKT
jgi:hypothetical protein